MYQSIPDIFNVPICYIYVPIYYVKKDFFNIQKTSLPPRYNFGSDFINEVRIRQNLVIGLSLPTQREVRWVRDRETMEKYAAEKGVAIKVTNADTDAAKQDSQVDELVSQGINILILAPVDSTAASATFEKVKKKGIKVIAYDRIIENSDVDLYVSFNNTVVGELQGRYITRNVPQGRYIILTGDPKDRNSKFYRDGAMEYIQPLVDKGDIRIVTDKAVENWDPKNAYKIVKDTLDVNSNIDAILAPNDAVAGAAIEALKTKDLAGKVVVTGQDADLAAARRIVQGTQAMTVFKDTRQLGKVAIESAIKLANNEPIEISGVVVDVSSILLTPTLVDRQNLNEVLIGSGYLKPEDVYQAEA
ncbi:MAG: substrate-binding domain-containing protein [Clostridiaceae bacterium]